MFPHMVQKVISELEIYLVEKDESQVQVKIRSTSEKGEDEIEKDSFRMIYSRNRSSHRHKLTYHSRKMIKGLINVWFLEK